MYKEVLRSVEGLGIFPTISFTIFFIFFISLLIYVIGMKKWYVDEVSHIPLEGNEPEENQELKEN